MRDHTRLHAFDLADELAELTYRETQSFPKREIFGLALQMRRAAVSVPSNIVEGCARNTLPEYTHFIHVAYGSAKELQYQIRLATKLGYLEHPEPLRELANQACMCLSGLIRGLQSDKLKEDKKQSTQPLNVPRQPDAGANGHEQTSEANTHASQTREPKHGLAAGPQQGQMPAGL